MMVETILESSQDFAMSNGSLPQWKRELLQRRAARSRPGPPPAPPAPPLPPPPTDEEELRYGPGIVKRLKSRYLSLALRDAPRRRPSVLRRAASLEHLLDEPPAPRPRPVSLAVPPAPPRRDSVKRARSVDALSRLDEPDAAPRSRPPRRPAPLLREAERPPADVVRAALRKFEAAPPRRTAPAARVSAVLRGLEGGPRSSTPEPRARSPSPAAADLSAIDEPECAAVSSKPVSRAALDGIARAGSTVRYSFESPKNGSHLPTVAASNPVLLGRARLWTSPRRIGVIRPMPAANADRGDASLTPPPEPLNEKSAEDSRVTSPLLEPQPEPRPEKRDPPSAAVEPIPRSPLAELAQTEVIRAPSPRPIPIIRESTPEAVDAKAEPRVMETIPKTALTNGHAEPARAPEPRARTPSRIGAAGIERAWTGARAKKTVELEEKKEPESKPAPWARKPRPPAPTTNSVVFNFSNRKEVPDYIENDGIILRSSRRNRIKAGEPGVVVLRPEAVARDSGSESDGEPERAPSPCAVRFVNDNVLINGRSSMRADRHRIAKLKLQFDDSLTRTFEYPSETSLCEESPTDAAPAAGPSPPPPAPAPAPAAPAPAPATLAANTHLVSGSLGRYTPSKTTADGFQLGLTRPRAEAESEQSNAPSAESAATAAMAAAAGEEAEAEAGDARPCAADLARSWSDARALSTDLLF